MRSRVDWWAVQRRLAQSPHLRLVVGTYGGRPALMRIGGSPLATTPKAALGVIAELCQPVLAKAA